MTTNPPTMQGVDIDAVHTHRKIQADHFPDAGKMVATTPTARAVVPSYYKMGDTASRVLAAVKATPGASTATIGLRVLGIKDTLLSKTLANLRQRGYIENRTGRSATWYATGKSEYVPPPPKLAGRNTKPAAKQKAKAARAPSKPAAPYQQREPHNKSKDPARIIALLEVHTVLTNARIAELLGLKTETARSRLCNMVSTGKVCRHFESQDGGPKLTVYRLPSKDTARRYRQTEVEGQDGTRLTTSKVSTGISDFLGWAPARAGSQDAFALPSREGNTLAPYTGIHSQCAGPGQLYMAPSRLQR